MTKRILLCILLGGVAPCAVAAQGLGFGARVGTLGLGGEVAIGLTEGLVVRGGMGITPLERGVTFSDVDVTLKLPTVYNVGLDLYLNGAVRLGGGVLLRSGHPEVTATFSASQDIGGTSFTPQEIGTLAGVIESSGAAPYVLIGFGRHTAEGVGLFLDLGFAFMGDPSVRLGARDGTLSDDAPPLMDALQREASDFENDMRGYLKFWPILSLGIRVGAQ
jgi:hypothetical protein